MSTSLIFRRLQRPNPESFRMLLVSKLRRPGNRQMAIHIRTKQVTDPLDERVRAQLCGYASSGSEHDGAVSVNCESCFSDFRLSFLDPDCDNGAVNEPVESSADDDSEGAAAMERAAEHAEKLRKLLEPLPEVDPFGVLIRSEVVAALLPQSRTASGLLRQVMARLREKGYNAGVCKARWGAAAGLTPGSYEYVDVIDASGPRYIVDLGFATEFELARATKEYEKVVGALPEIVVARLEDVKVSVIILSEAAERSLKRRGMCVPPWRKHKYMMAKWLGPYRRTVNLVSVFAPEESADKIMRRIVGFGL